MFDEETMAERMRAQREWLETAPGRWPAKRELADAMREVLDLLSSTDVDEAVLTGLTADLRATAERFRSRVLAEEPSASDFDHVVSGMETIHERSPVVGRSNPIAPPLRIEVDHAAREVVGEVSFSRAYEGAPGCAHGGWVAAVLDDALGMACVFSGGPAMTGELTTRYLKHTPIEQRLTVRARYDGREGRRIRSSGEVYAGDVRVAEANGTFIAVDVEKFARLRDAKRTPST